MSGAFFDSMRDGLSGVLELFLKIALPLAIFLGLFISATIVGFAIKGSVLTVDWPNLRKSSTKVASYLGVGLVVVCLWSGLKQVQPAAKSNIGWKESAEASDNPAPEAPPIDQYGPIAAVMIDKTYRRSLTLPPDFVQRIGADGVEVLSPYLVDPTAENVLKLADTFKRSGRDVVFTREVTREDEEPISFDNSVIKLAFHRLQEQAYEVDFSASYTFTNTTDTAIKARFVFPLPEGGGTIQNLKVEVGGQDVTESANAGRSMELGPSEGAPLDEEPSPNSPREMMSDRSEPNSEGDYSWTGTMNPGESRKATVRYKAIGSRSWSYDLGSSRRRVKDLSVEASIDGIVQFAKWGIQPASHSGSSISWKLKDVVTSQRLALTFPRDVRMRESYLQALAVLPATLILFGLGLLLALWRLQIDIRPSQIASGLVIFGFGLGSTMVLANYLGPVAAVLVGPVLGGVLASRITNWRTLLVVLPISLFPAASLSPQNTGIWVLVLAVLVAVGYAYLPRFVSPNGRTKT